MTISLWALLTVIGCLLLVAELATGTFVLLSLGIGCFATAALFQLAGLRSAAVLILAFAVVSTGSGYALTQLFGPTRGNRESDVSEY